MKKIIELSFGLLPVLLFSFFCISCNKDEEPGTVTENNMLSVNGVESYKLPSAFSNSGIAYSVENENLISVGITSSLFLMDDLYTDFPGQNNVKVEINAVFYYNEIYNSSAECVNHITVKDLPDIGNLYINLNHGRYEGTNEQVSSVVIGSCEDMGHFSTDNQMVNVHITITLKDSTIIEIKYKGAAPNDGRI